MPPKDKNQSAASAAAAATADPATTPPAPDTTGTTRLDSDVTKPSVTAPGDGPADTTDPTEQASSVPPQPGKEALIVGTVNAVVPVPTTTTTAAKTAKGKGRIEKYTATRPDGTEATVTRNIDTGETTVS